jgi:hypothetical protein
MRSWKDIVSYAEEYFEYMLHHDVVRKGEETGHMDHFHIHCANDASIPYYSEIQLVDGVGVERAIMPWIRQEEQSGRLSDRTLWRPFRSLIEEADSMMAYRRMFVYEPEYHPNRPFEVEEEFGGGVVWSRSGTDIGDRLPSSPYGPQEVARPDGTYPRMIRIFFMLTIMNSCPMRGCPDSHHLIEQPPHYVASLYGWEEDDTPYWKPSIYCFKCDSRYEEIRYDPSTVCLVPDSLWMSPPLLLPWYDYEVPQMPLSDVEDDVEGDLSHLDDIAFFTALMQRKNE